MIAVDKPAPARRREFSVSGNSPFTPIDAPVCDRVENLGCSYSGGTFVGRDGSKVVARKSFFRRTLEVRRGVALARKVDMACACGALPDHQGLGFTAKVWRAAEESQSTEVDRILVYTGEDRNEYFTSEFI
jgi:hypothetical protein